MQKFEPTKQRCSLDISVPTNTLEDCVNDHQGNSKLKGTNGADRCENLKLLGKGVSGIQFIESKSVIQPDNPEKVLEGLRINTSSSREQTTPKGFGNQSDFQSLSSNQDLCTQESNFNKYEMLSSDGEILKQIKPLYPELSKANSSGYESKEQIEILQIELLKKENYNLQFHLGQYVNRNESLTLKVRELEEDKSRAIILIKKFEEQMKSVNNKYSLLQKKITHLEKENRELAANLKTCEAEKRTFSERWQKLSKKSRAEESYKSNCKNIEAELCLKNKEIEELLEKFYLTKAELQITKEREEIYKSKFEEQTIRLKDMTLKLEATKSDKDNLLAKNTKLINILEKIIDKTNNYQIDRKGIEKMKYNETVSELLDNDKSYENFSQPDQENKEDSKLGTQYLCYNSLIDETIEMLQKEIKEKLSQEDYNLIEDHIKKHIKVIHNMLDSNEINNKYHKLLRNYFKALEKIKTLEKAFVEYTLNRGIVGNEDISDLLLSSNPPKRKTDEYKELVEVSISNTDRESLCISQKKQYENSGANPDMSNFINQEEKKSDAELLINTYNEFVNSHHKRSKSLEKLKIIRKSSKDEETERRPVIDIRNYASNTDIQHCESKRRLQRSNSTLRSNRSYHEIHSQKRKDNVTLNMHVGDYSTNRL